MLFWVLDAMTLLATSPEHVCPHARVQVSEKGKLCATYGVGVQTSARAVDVAVAVTVVGVASVTVSEAISVVRAVLVSVVTVVASKSVATVVGMVWVAGVTVVDTVTVVTGAAAVEVVPTAPMQEQALE